MPPFHSRSTGSRRMARMTSFGGALALSRPSSARFRRQRDRFRRTREDAPAAGELLAVVIVPARARQREQAGALGETHRGLRVRIDKDMTVIEGGLQPDVPR